MLTGVLLTVLYIAKVLAAKSSNKTYEMPKFVGNSLHQFILTKFMKTQERGGSMEAHGPWRTRYDHGNFLSTIKKTVEIPCWNYNFGFERLFRRIRFKNFCGCRSPVPGRCFDVSFENVLWILHKIFWEYLTAVVCPLSIHPIKILIVGLSEDGIMTIA